MKQVTLYEVATFDDVSNILEHFSVDELDEISREDLHAYLCDEYGEEFDRSTAESTTFDLIDNDDFLDYRVDDDSGDEGYCLQVYHDGGEVLVWQYFEITESEY